MSGLLGNKVPGVTAWYAHMPDSVLVAADAVSTRIAEAMGKAPAPA
jgi:hypothetical protein